MKITYVHLENVAGLVVGSGIDTLEIDLRKSVNKIVAIIAKNASGKSVLLSSLTPFANITSIDERSTLSYIVPGKNGYKEIHYEDNMNSYKIKHYYKPTGKSHTVKSYFSINDEELNENGNVKSFLSLIEFHMGLTPDMLRLIRIGTNVTSVLSLPPAARKDYVGKLIEEIDIYMMIFKGINDDMKVVKAMMSSNSMNLYNCHITDPLIEEDKLANLQGLITSHEKTKDNIVAKLATINNMIASNDIGDLKKKRIEAESSIEEFRRVEELVQKQNLQDASIDQLSTKRSDLVSTKIDVHGKINSYRISIDNALQNIERIDASVKKITSNNDVQSLMNAITSLRESTSNTNQLIKDFQPPNGIDSDSINSVINKLSSFNVIAQTIRSLGNKPSEVYLKLRKSHVYVEKWLKEQVGKTSSGLKPKDIKDLYDQVLDGGSIITPNCDTEYTQCPYYKFAELLEKADKESKEEYDTETLRYIQVISRNIDLILNEMDVMRKMKLPDSLKEYLTEKNILDRMEHKLVFFDLSDFNHYLTIVKAHEIYKHDCDRLREYEHQLSIYKKSGIDGQMDEIRQLKQNIEFYRSNITTLTSRVHDIDEQISIIDGQITLLSRYQDGKKYRKMFESTLESTMKLLVPLEQAEQDKRELQFKLEQEANMIATYRDSHRELENKIREYNRLLKEGEELSEKFKDLTVILKTASTKQGIPVVYMKHYLGKIKSLANNLLRLIYGDSFRLAKFEISPDSFEIPYVKNGTKVRDVKYSSQSEFAMSNIAISFALTNAASGKYNIPLLDEIDNGLDESNRVAFLRMIEMQMKALHAEQSFIISQNISQMVNVPMDVIQLGDVNSPRSKLQNIIYESRGA